MSLHSNSHVAGFTILELMVTLLIVTVVTATLSVSVVTLLTFREQDKDEALIRERLADVCALYSDYISIGSSVSNEHNAVSVQYRRETGGVSLETGVVSHVVSMAAALNGVNNCIDINVSQLDCDIEKRAHFRSISGDNPSMLSTDDIVGFSLTPLAGSLYYFELRAVAPRNRRQAETEVTATVGRVVRLWNQS